YWEGTENIYQANVWTNSKHSDPVPTLGEDYLIDLGEYVNNLRKNSEAPIEVAFVDPGIYLRGDLVETCLQLKIPVVVLHDAESFWVNSITCAARRMDDNVYGLFKIREHKEYTRIFLPPGAGTMFWIHE